MKFTDLKEEALLLWRSGEYESHMKLAEYLYEKYDLVGNVDYSRRTLSNWINSDSLDKEIVAENVKLAKQKQKQLSVYLKDLAKSINISNCGIVNGGVGIIQITDTHGNELLI